MFRNQQVEGIGFVVSQSAGVHIRLIIHFLEGFLDLVAAQVSTRLDGRAELGLRFQRIRQLSRQYP